MRLLVVSAPVMGHAKLAAILRALIGHERLPSLDLGAAPEEVGFETRLASGDLPDTWIHSGYYPVSERLTEALHQARCQVVLIVRDPHDAFESAYFTANSPRNRQLFLGSALAPVVDKALGSDSVHGFLRDDYPGIVDEAVRWAGLEGVHVVRWEDLHQDPGALLQDLVHKLTGSVPDADQVLRVARSLLGQNNRWALFSPDQGSIRYYSANRLDADLLSRISAATGPYRSAFSYPDRTTSPGAWIRRDQQRFCEYLGKAQTCERFFVLGFGKSGTTWLHLIFFNHPDARVVAERKLVENPDEEYALLEDLYGDDFERWFANSSFGIRYPEQGSVRYSLGLSASEYLLFRQLDQRNDGNGLSSVDGFTHIGEKIALNRRRDAALLMQHLRHCYPDACLIHIIRDPRDIAVSSIFHRYREFKARGQTNWITAYVEGHREGKRLSRVLQPMLYKDIANTVREWQGVVSEFDDRGVADFGSRYMGVRYEDLLGHPQEVVSRILDHVRIRNTAAIRQEILSNTAFDRLARGRRQGEEDAASFYRKGISGDWRNHFGPDINKRVVAMAPSLRRLGYED